jgi:hypothetical protein
MSELERRAAAAVHWLRLDKTIEALERDCTGLLPFATISGE